MCCVDVSTGQVPEYLKRQKEPDQLAALLQMLQCLLNNKHFAFLEIYVSGVVCSNFVKRNLDLDQTFFFFCGARVARVVLRDPNLFRFRRVLLS